MAGYLPDEATADAFADGWYRTGDVGWLEPEGWVHLTDRSKEMIKVSGFQVAPAEIEAVLLGHPAVVDCAVFGVPDERAGEVPVAAVQLEPGVDRRPRRSSSGSSPTRWPPTSACATSSSSTPSRGPRRARCCGARCGTSGPRPSPPADGPTDGRPPLARAGGPAGRRGAGRRPAGRPRTVRRARRRASAPPSSTRRSSRRAGASCGRRTDDGDPWASAVEVAIVAEELGRGLADTAFLGPTLAAELRRRPGAPDGDWIRDGRAARRPRRLGDRRASAAPPRAPVALDAPGHAAALVLVGGGAGYALGRGGARAGRSGGVDLHPAPRRRRPSPRTVTALDGQSRPLRPRRRWTRGAASAWPSPAPTWSG